MTALIYLCAALAEIAGCFAFWAWLRMGKSPLWLAPGVISLILFAWLLTRVDSDAAGRAYAAYGGIYICASLAWLWTVEGVRPDRWDVGGAALCLIGTCVILLGPANRLMPVRTLSDPDHLPALDRRYAIERPALGLGAGDPPPRILLLYGSLRERSFSRLCVEEAARLLRFFGCETRIFDPSTLPLPDQQAGDDHPAVHELRELSLWSKDRCGAALNGTARSPAS